MYIEREDIPLLTDLGGLLYELKEETSTTTSVFDWLIDGAYACQDMRGITFSDAEHLTGLMTQLRDIAGQLHAVCIGLESAYGIDPEVPYGMLDEDEQAADEEEEYGGVERAAAPSEPATRWHNRRVTEACS